MEQLVSHYQEDGTPVRKDVFVDNVWKQLALEQSGSIEDTFEFPKFMQLIHELKVVRNVLESIISGEGQVETIEIPPGTAEAPRRIFCRFESDLVSKKLKDEANRLKKSLQEMQGDIMTRIIPLIQGGWRLNHDEEGWKADIGIDQLFSPVHPHSSLKSLVDLEIGDKPGNHQLLYINGWRIEGPQSRSEGEFRLFEKQLTVLSVTMYHSLYEAAKQSNDFELRPINALKFILSWKDTPPITIMLSSDSDDMAMPTGDPTICRKLMRAFLENKNESIDLLKAIFADPQ